MAPSCFGGGSQQRDVADPLGRTGGARAWPAVSTGYRHAARDEELAEARAAAQTLRDRLRAANAKAALMLSYRDAAEQECRGVREHTQRLQVGGLGSERDLPYTGTVLPAWSLRHSAQHNVRATAPLASVPHRSNGVHGYPHVRMQLS